jgi:hypothetical protein
MDDSKAVYFWAAWVFFQHDAYYFLPPMLGFTMFQCQIYHTGMQVRESALACFHIGGVWVVRHLSWQERTVMA